MAKNKDKQKTKAPVEVLPDEKEKGVWQRFIHLMQRSHFPWRWVILSALISFANTLLSLAFPDYQKKIVDGDFRAMTITIGILILLGQAVTAGLVGLMSGYTRRKLERNMRQTIWNSILHLPVDFINKNTARSLITRTTADVESSSYIVSSIITSILAVYSLISATITVSKYYWSLAAINVILIPIIIVTKYYNGKLNFKFTSRIQYQISRTTQRLSETLINIPLVKAFVTEDYEIERGRDGIRGIFRENFNLQKVYYGFNVVNSLLEVLTKTIAIAYGAYLISTGHITLGTWIAYFVYSTLILSKAGDIASIWTDLKSSEGAVNRISGIIKSPLEAYQGAALEAGSGNIEFKNVSFSYDTRPVLDNVSFVIPAGKTTALVGPSGGGKSTILNLIERFYLPQSGDILYEGANISGFDLSSWRSKMAYVSQEERLYSGTIRFNITQGIERSIGDEELESALKSMDIAGFVAGLDDGLETDIGEGANRLSGGEKQRLALARAVLKKPDMLLLDEATSFVGVESRQKVETMLSEVAKGRTCVIASHYMPSVTAADHIIVVNAGKILDAGAPADLYQRCALYKQLVDAQAPEQSLGGN
jgi:ATP-binding cassette subfamily B protein AbcA/BmrA